MHHPDGEAEVLGVARALQYAVAHPEVLVAHPLEPEVGVPGTELTGAGQRGVAERAVGEVGERLVQATHDGEPTPTLRGGRGGPMACLDSRYGYC